MQNRMWLGRRRNPPLLCATLVFMPLSQAEESVDAYLDTLLEELLSMAVFRCGTDIRDAPFASYYLKHTDRGASWLRLLGAGAGDAWRHWLCCGWIPRVRPVALTPADRWFPVRRMLPHLLAGTGNWISGSTALAL